MKIDGTDISTFGLIVQSVKGYNDLPALKKILVERSFTANDIKFNEKEVAIKLFGQYASSTALETGVKGLRTLLESDVVHDFLFTSRSINFDGVARNGFKAKVFRNDVSIDLVLGIVV